MTFEWYEYPVAFCVFIFFLFFFLFLFRNNVIRDQLDVNDFSCCYVFLPESTIPKVLDHSYVQISLSTITSQLDNSIWKTPYTEYFMDIGVKLALSHLTYYCMLPFSQTSLVFKFNLLLIEWFLPQFIYLSTFWYCILKFISYLYALFIRASKARDSMLFFVKVYSYKMLMFFLFSMKH